jgi:hypothetical protein
VHLSCHWPVLTLVQVKKQSVKGTRRVVISFYLHHSLNHRLGLFCVYCLFGAGGNRASGSHSACTYPVSFSHKTGLVEKAIKFSCSSDDTSPACNHMYCGEVNMQDPSSQPKSHPDLMVVSGVMDQHSISIFSQPSNLGCMRKALKWTFLLNQKFTRPPKILPRRVR